MSIQDIFVASKIKKENDELKALISEIGASDALVVKRKIEEFQNTAAQLTKEIDTLNSRIDQLNIEVKKKTEELIVLDEDILLESFALYKPKFAFSYNEEYKNRLDICRQKQKELIKIGSAIQINENWTVNNSKSEGKKMVNDMKKLLLRSFNNECDYCVDNVKFNNIETHEKRILKSFETLNTLGRIMQGKITQEYRSLKFEELYLAYEYQQKKQDEKEAQKRAREEMREQQKLEQEIRQAREKILKEKKHFNQALDELARKLSGAIDEFERDQILRKIEEVKNQCMELDKEEKVIDYREQNAKAGYVYVISNIGAFGKDVYKIGMTRRLEPGDRIDELGDASVPFSFDIHAMIFSDNAPLLEAKLHEHFYRQRINKVNDRKEFYKADISEIEKIVKENYNQIIDIVKEAPAEQFRESQKMN
ncbi:MAG: DUF4041 domain-containing protein [Bacillota bacterium]